MNFLKVLLFFGGSVLISFFWPSLGISGRPLVVDDAMPVGPGQVELEIGLLQGQPRRGGREQKFPVMALTHGLADGLEFGLGIQRANSDTDGQAPVKGFEDLHLVSKYRFVSGSVYLPALAFAFDLKVPTASQRKGLSSGEFDENFLLIATKDFSPLAVDLNAGYLLVDSPPREKLKNRVLGGLALRSPLPGNWVLLGEIFGLSRKASGKKNEVNFQIGTRYQFARSIVFDAALGRSLRSTGTVIQATFGVTWSFPLDFSTP